MTDTATRLGPDPVFTARRQVIEESGWGAHFRVVQPRNFTFWVMAFLFVSGMSLTYQGFRGAAEAYTESFAQGFAFFTLFALVFLWIFARLDRYSSIPAKAKVVAFLFSGLVSTFAMAGINNDAFRSILAKTVSLEFMQAWSAGLTAPWSEEIVKLLPVVLLIGLAPRVMRCAFDGFIIGAISGLAFQVFEDVAYVYGTAAANFGQAEYGTSTLGVRTALSAGHWAWSAVAGAGLIYLIGRPSEPRRRGLGIALILASMFMHWLWDSVTPLTGGATWAIAVYLPITLINLALFIWVYRRTVLKERTWARALLADEVARGFITADELDAAVGSRKDRKRFVKSQPNRRRTKHVLEATNDLADEIAHAYAHDTPQVEHARTEIARLRG
ncbi:MAG: PrsW family intramembrane metalloprotease [Nocardioides sp.]